MSEQGNDKSETTRRAFMVGGAAAALGATAAARPVGPHKITDAQARLLDQVTAASTASASLSDVKHIVILMQENRSFDHYFGTISGVRGFSDPGVLKNAYGTPIFDQYGYQPGTGVDASGYLQPFRLLNNPPAENGEATNDISHGWTTQHQSWNGGKLDSFIKAHLAADGTTNGPVTMGHFTRSELAFYYALADAFTICDNYFCSVLGPTDPNRLMAMSANIDPAGKSGGPVITTATDRLAMTGALNWKTMPEALLAAGVSWKVYNDPTGILGLGVLSYFKNYTNPFSLTGLELIAKGLTPSYPDDFKTDVKNGTLPSVSWIVPPLAEWRDFKGNFVDPIIKVRAKRAPPHEFHQVDLRSRDQTHVHTSRGCAAQAKDLTRLDCPQKLRLKLNREVVNVVQEKRALARQLKQSLFRIERAGEGAPLITKKFAFQEFVR